MESLHDQKIIVLNNLVENKHLLGHLWVRLSIFDEALYCDENVSITSEKNVDLKSRSGSNAGMGAVALESTSDLCLGSKPSMDRYHRREKKWA